ncbi:MAG: U32 family peptidase [Chitinispirillaceae bacterium]|nr:U32 family peptidase [Chitinispirillaceae bacterium]
MNLSVAYTFEPGIIDRLAQFPDVKEIYGKLDRDCIGGGRATFTLRRTPLSRLNESISNAHAHGIAFNYLINAANMAGLEQTRSGQRKIRRLLDRIDESGADGVTVSTPYLLRLVKSLHPRLKARVGVFAVVDGPEKARRWEDLGADTICVSAIACNRNFNRLRDIRRAVRCNLELLVNASCLPGCAYELTHMNMLSQSSRTGDRLGGFCLDYCFLDCSARRLSDPVNFIKAVWIRPEDIVKYEQMGYNWFKIVERSCPGDLLIRRVKAYTERYFDGNLYELIAPVAQIKRGFGVSRMQQIRMATIMAKPWLVKMGPLLLMKSYIESVLVDNFNKEGTPVYIDNKALDGFLDGIRLRDCDSQQCDTCGYCRAVAGKVVTVEPQYREKALSLAARLDEGLVSGKHWF